MPAEIRIYNAAELGTPLGAYSHVTRVRAQEYLFIAGMLATDKAGNIIGKGDFDAQAVQVFANVRLALESEGHEVHETETITRAAVALLIDQSFSMVANDT